MSFQRPTTQRAAVYRGPRDVRLETVPVPACGPGEVLLQVTACGVCGTDLKKIQLGLQSPPRIYGHETVGRIVELGAGVRDWALGERVAVYHHVPCGQCRYCRRGVPSQCPGYKRTGVTAGYEPAGGGFAEYVRVMDWIVAGGGLVRVPDHVDDHHATFVEPVNTCLKGLARGDVQSGDTVAVYGAGPIGLLLGQLARRRGATVISSDLLPGRRALAARLGWQAVPPDDLPAAVATASAGEGADTVFLAVAHSGLLPAALELLRPGGRVVLFAQTRFEDPVTIDAGQLGVLDKVVLGAYSSDQALDSAAAAAVFERQIEVAPLISAVYPLAEIAAALERAATPSDDVLKVLVTP
ncbi:MAG: alcohol dehydrogenase catalytic domain-containing protein [Fimbriimonadaceae bacterium]|nr:alcohol dehydrogenase catalytic domain-containing protein [Fimbriimonadaceae bacterium]